MSGLEDRADRLYKLIDSDDSSLIGRRELERLLVQNGSSPASALEALNAIFNHANLEGIKHVNIVQFKTLFTTAEQTSKEGQIAQIVLEQLEAVVGKLPSDVRAEAIFKLIDSDDSGLISRRELIELMVSQGNSSMASASMSADKLFSQANMGNHKQVTLDQFLKLFEHEKRLRGAASEDETLKWFESLVQKLPPVHHHYHKTSPTRDSTKSHHGSQSSSPKQPLWFEKPMNSPTNVSNSHPPSEVVNHFNLEEETRPNTATRNVAARAEARRKAMPNHPSKHATSKSVGRKEGSRIKEDTFDNQSNMSTTIGANTMHMSNEKSVTSSSEQSTPPPPAMAAMARRKSRRGSVEAFPLNGDVSKYSREGKDGKKTFKIAGCDARMKATFNRLDIDGLGTMSRHELESHMSHCSEYGGEAAVEPSQRANECVKYSEVKPHGSFTLEDYAHLFKAEIEAKGEASAMSMLQWFEMVASRLPKHEDEENGDGFDDENNQKPSMFKQPMKTNSFMPRSLSQYDMTDEASLDSIHESNHLTPRFTTPPSTAEGSGMRGQGRTVDSLGGGDEKDEAAQLLEDRLGQVAQRAEVRKMKKREKFKDRANKLHKDIMNLKLDRLIGLDNKNESTEGLSLNELIEILMTPPSTQQTTLTSISLIDATKSAKDIFDQAEVDHNSLMLSQGLETYALKEIDLRSERSCDDTLRWLETLTKTRGSLHPNSVNSSPLPTTSTTISPSTSISPKQNEEKEENVVKPYTEKEEFWEGDNLDVDENGQPFVVACTHGSAEMDAMKSLRRQGSFSVPVLKNTPQGSSMDENEENVKIEKKIEEEKSSNANENDKPVTIRAVTPLHDDDDDASLMDIALEDPSLSQSPAVVKAVKLTKAASVARANYLRTAVDPVFVPLLDSVVLNKPRDVTTYVAEECLKKLIERGTEAEKEVVRAMMKRILDHS